MGRYEDENRATPPKKKKKILFMGEDGFGVVNALPSHNGVTPQGKSLATNARQIFSLHFHSYSITHPSSIHSFL